MDLHYKLKFFKSKQRKEKFATDSMWNFRDFWDTSEIFFTTVTEPLGLCYLQYKIDTSMYYFILLYR